MTYALAKQLKDAGFPIRKTCLCEEDVCVHIEYPTLSELIEACGDSFGELNHYRNSRDWEAISENWQDEQGVGRMTSGKTPEEAVAKLWLALNAS